jgi:hypothetical protein
MINYGLGIFFRVTRFAHRAIAYIGQHIFLNEKGEDIFWAAFSTVKVMH